MRYLYSIFFYLLIPFLLLRLLWRSRHSQAYRSRWGERLGYFHVPKEYQNSVVIHAVSVGETMAAVPLIRALQTGYPSLRLIVTTMTVTGSERVRALFGGSVFHIYLPYDSPTAVKRFLKKTNPRLFLIMETELWPNLLHYCHALNIPLVLANARLSEKSASGYARFGKFSQSMLNNLTLIAVQARADAERFIRLGIPPDRVYVTGNTKFDLKVSASVEEGGELLRQQLGAHRPVWIAASTREGEEEKILKAFKAIKRKIPRSLLILVPRHPERFTRVEQMCRQFGFKILLRSEKKSCSEGTDIFLGDTMGEMLLFYSASNLAFVGGSLLPEYGGQNLMEPAWFKLPILTGQYLRNFEEAKRLLQEAEALVIVKNEQELAEQVIRFFENDSLRQKYGEGARRVVDTNAGAVDRHLLLISRWL